MYNNRYTASHFPLQMHHHVGKSTYINTSSAIVDCFPESMITLDVESINGQFIMLVSAFITGLTLKMTPSLCVYCICSYITHDCGKVLYGFKTLHSLFNILELSCI